MPIYINNEDNVSNRVKQLTSQDGVVCFFFFLSCLLRALFTQCLQGTSY